MDFLRLKIVCHKEAVTSLERLGTIGDPEIGLQSSPSVTLHTTRRM